MSWFDMRRRAFMEAVVRTYTLTITGNTWSSSYRYFKYPGSAGTKYYSNGSIDIESGKVIYVYVKGSSGWYSKIRVNGVVVASDMYQEKTLTYSHTVTGNTAINCYAVDRGLGVHMDITTT